MIVLDCPQGSPEWFAARLGIPTASQFDRILTPKTRKPAAGAETYLHELLAEWLTGVPSGPEQRGFMERGSEMEEWAVGWYEFTREVSVRRVGTVLRDDRLVAGSPDALVGDDGGLEIKCPSASQHIANLLDGRERYYAQAQGCLLLTGRRWWDVLSYHPEIPAHVVRYERDEEYLTALAGALEGFVARLLAARERLCAMGCEPRGLDRDFAASLVQAGVE